MTHHELAELLRDHVSSDEPPTPLPHPALASGRRRLRTRRFAGAGAALAVLAVAGAVVGPRIGGGGPDTAMDPVSSTALEAYDVHRMPELMDQHVRQVLVASVPDLGPSTFRATDSQARELPEASWDKASGLSVSFGSRAHEYDVSISHSRGEAEGDPDAYCASGLAEGYYLDCTVARPDGAVVLTTLAAIKPMVVNGTAVEPESWMGVTEDRLDTVALDQLYFVRTVKVIKSETLLTYVEERVKATDRDPATAPFATPTADLAAIGTDPELVMPVPPPGDNGCPAWSMPIEGQTISCE